ncbi:MAG: DMT family transporter [Verrucomicrobiae bacterium]|nr:DMT family transporter [Verrucomicrobiae bacterium]
MDRVVLLLLLVVLIWGGNNAVMRWLALTTPVFCVAWTRGLLAGLPLLFWVWRREGSLGVPRADRRDFLINGFLGLAVFQVAFIWSLRWTTAAHGALLLALGPLFSALWERAWEGREIRPAFVAGAVVAAAGVAIVVGLDALRFRNLMQALGDALALGGSVAWAFYSTYQKRLLLRGHSPAKVTGFSALCTAVVTTPFAVWEICNGNWRGVGWAQVGGQLYSAWLATLLAQLAWSHAIRREPASVVMLFQSIVPVTTALAAWALLDEPVTWLLLWGGLLIIAGVAYARRA